MAAGSSTFSESWHRVAGQRLRLRHGVNIRRQNYRGERWFVVENPLTNDFFRLSPAGYAFVARLDGKRTVDGIWHECLEKVPDEAPSQEEALNLLAQLYFANLLQYDAASDSASLFDRFKKRRQREWRARFLNVMFMRFPLLDPDRFLVRTMPLVGKLIGVWGGILWLVVLGWALKLVFDSWDSLKAQSQGVLAPSNLPLLYLGLIIVKSLHEFGHAYFTRRFGGEVHVMGVLLMIFTPVPYIDASSSWSFRSRSQRLLVGAAGMMVELFVASLAVFVWAYTGQGTLHSLAYNIMFVASVSTLIFNANPLLRFDGYYMLSDLLEIPNLAQRSNGHLRHLGERWLFGLKKSESPADTFGEAFWFTTYGILSGIYRVVVFGGVLLVVADRFFLIGIVMAIACFVSWITVPVGKFLYYLASSPKLERNRPRAVTVSILLIALVVGLLQFVPFPSHFRAPGVAQTDRWSQVINEAPGQIAELTATPGSHVRVGDPLVRLKSPELELSLQHARATQKEIEIRIAVARAKSASNLKPLFAAFQEATNRVFKLEEDQTALLVKARHDGLWVAPEVKDFVGRWIPRGTQLGLLVDESAFQFRSTVKQEDAERLFGRDLRGAEVRLFGQAGKSAKVKNLKIVPGGQSILPSPALGWQAGGDLPVAPGDQTGTKAAEPFFEVQGTISPEFGVVLVHGLTGNIRFEQAPEPLLPRFIRAFRQLVQKRYQI